MNARIQRALSDARDIPIEKPADELPSIFGSVRRSGFTTARKVRRHDSREATAENPRLKPHNN